MDNETWVIEEGGRIIDKVTRVGIDGLTTWERLVHALWAADYGMRNAGDLSTARDVQADFQSVALKAATALALPVTGKAFALPPEALERYYFELFEAICDEIRSAAPPATPDTDCL